MDGMKLKEEWIFLFHPPSNIVYLLDWPASAKDTPPPPPTSPKAEGTPFGHPFYVTHQIDYHILLIPASDMSFHAYPSSPHLSYELLVFIVQTFIG